MKNHLAFAAAFFLAGNGFLTAQTEPSRNCRLIVDADSGRVLVKEGPCEVRQSPCSTFKIPLAVMGFDSGILTDEHNPVWSYLPEYNSSRPEEKQSTDPTSWEKNSVVWYSQKLTHTMGMPAFQKYVDQFKYGNMDLSGNPGKNDGLTEAWLMSSLLISPEEQVAFLRKLLRGDLGFSRESCDKTEAILPSFPAADGWTLSGKTGSGFQKKPDGSLDRQMHLGWFVGWASKGDRRVVFAELILDVIPNEKYGGPRARDAMIKALPGIMKKSKAMPQ